MILKEIRKFFQLVRPFVKAGECRIRIAGGRAANERGRVFERMADYATPIRATDYGLVFSGSKTVLRAR